jgi:hypothetical protein
MHPQTNPQIVVSDFALHSTHQALPWNSLFLYWLCFASCFCFLVPERPDPGIAGTKFIKEIRFALMMVKFLFSTKRCRIREEFFLP